MKKILVVISMLVCCVVYLSFFDCMITAAILGVVTIIFGFIDTYLLWDEFVFLLFQIDKRIDEFPLVFVEVSMREKHPARIYKGSDGYYHVQIYYTFDGETTDEKGKKVTNREEHYFQKKIDKSKVKQFYVNLVWSCYFPYLRKIADRDMVIHNIIDDEDRVMPIDKLPLVSGNNSKWIFNSINNYKYPLWHLKIKKSYDDYFNPYKYLDINDKGIFIERENNGN